MGSARKLERESGVVLNPIEDPSKLYEDVKRGRWSDVLRTARWFTLSKQVSMDLYEHIALEMIDNKKTPKDRPRVANSLKKNVA